MALFQTASSSCNKPNNELDCARGNVRLSYANRERASDRYMRHVKRGRAPRFPQRWFVANLIYVFPRQRCLRVPDASSSAKFGGAHEGKGPFLSPGQEINMSGDHWNRSAVEMLWWSKSRVKRGGSEVPLTVCLRWPKILRFLYALLSRKLNWIKDTI